MKNRCSTRIRGTAGCAALGLLLAAGLAGSAPGFAQEGKDEAHRTIIVKHVGEGGKELVIDGKRLSELRAKCASDRKQEADVRSGEGKDSFRTRVTICGEGEKADSAETRKKLAEALERARAGLAGHDMLSDKARAEAAEALAREIARLRSEGR